MSSVSVKLARDPDDFEDARRLCRAWLDWHWRNYPTDWPIGADHPMDPDNFLAVVEKLPELHARPKGGILIGSVDERVVGCVMYHEAGAGVAEFKRMFVDEGGRGHGVGSLLLRSMFEQMKVDGYRKVFFSSATFLTHASEMYRAAGFYDIPHPDEFPEGWRDRVYFMERALLTSEDFQSS